MKRSVAWFIVLLFSICILATQSSALGVAQDYLENQTLRLMQGSTFDLNLYMQNPEDEVVPVQLLLSSDIAFIVDAQELYNLSPKSYKNGVVIHIEAPEDAQLGKRYLVRYSMIPHQEQSGSGQIGMRMKITRSFTVLIVDENGVGNFPKPFYKDITLSKPTKLALLIIVLIAAIGLVIFLLVKKSSALSNMILSKKQPSSKSKKGISKKKSTKNSTKTLSSAQTKKLASSLKNCKSEKEIQKVLKRELGKKK